MLTNNTSLKNNALPQIITINVDNKVCIPKDTTMGTLEVISNDSCSISEIPLTVRHDNSTTYAQTIQT